MTITEFLLARIAEDEERARAAHYDGQQWIAEEEAVVAADRDWDPVMFLDRKKDAAHAANWSPARVLAECEAKRRIVKRATRLAEWDEMGSSTRDDGDFILAELARPYAGHRD